MVNLIGISGYAGSGKDEVAKILKRVLLEKYNKTFEIKRFADPIKDFVCLLLNCTRAQLEDRSIKSLSLQELADKGIINKEFVDLLDVENKITKKSTIRDIMQILGTDLLREGFNNNIHVAATLGSIKENEKIIIPDVRFPNEAKAIKDRGGVIIRVEKFPETITVCRGFGDCDEAPFDPTSNNHLNSYRGQQSKDKHKSEISLDSYEDFDYVINNNGTLEELEQKVIKLIEEL